MGYAQELGTALVSATAVTAVLGYFGKTVVEKWLDRRFKKTDENTAKEFEQFKSALNAFNARNDTLLKTSQPERLKVVMELFPLSLGSKDALRHALDLREMFKGVTDGQAEMVITIATGRAATKLDAFVNYFRDKNPLFSPDTIRLVNDWQKYLIYVSTCIPPSIEIDDPEVLLNEMETRHDAFIAELQRLVGVE